MTNLCTLTPPITALISCSSLKLAALAVGCLGDFVVQSAPVWQALSMGKVVDPVEGAAELAEELAVPVESTLAVVQVEVEEVLVAFVTSARTLLYCH